MNRSQIRNVILKLYVQDHNIVNSRTALLAGVWRELGWNDNLTLEHNLRQLPSPETVSRALRRLHEQGMVSYTEKELERRTTAFKSELRQHSAMRWLDD